MNTFVFLAVIGASISPALSHALRDNPSMDAVGASYQNIAAEAPNFAGAAGRQNEAVAPEPAIETSTSVERTLDGTSVLEMPNETSEVTVTVTVTQTILYDCMSTPSVSGVSPTDSPDAATDGPTSSTAAGLTTTDDSTSPGETTQPASSTAVLTTAFGNPTQTTEVARPADPMLSNTSSSITTSTGFPMTTDTTMRTVTVSTSFGNGSMFTAPIAGTDRDSASSYTTPFDNTTATATSAAAGVGIGSGNPGTMVPGTAPTGSETTRAGEETEGTDWPPFLPPTATPQPDVGNGSGQDGDDGPDAARKSHSMVWSWFLDWLDYLWKHHGGAAGPMPRARRETPTKSG